MQLVPPQSIDPNVPSRIPADQLQDFKSFLDVVLDSVIGGAAPDVHTLGLQLWGGLAAVMVAWTGLKIAFSGTFEPWAIVKLVIGIAIPRTLLHYYIVPIPGVGLTFPAMVAGGGIWLQNLFLSDVVSAGYTEMTALVQAYGAHLGAAWSSGNLLSVVTAGVSVLFSSLVSLAMGASLVFSLVALFCVTYAQVIWAQVALAIVILLGSRVHRLPALRAARVPVLGMVPLAHGLHALRRRGRGHPTGLHGRRHGLHHDLRRRPDGHRLLRPGRALAVGRRPASARRLRPDGRTQGRRTRLDARLRLRLRRVRVHGPRRAGSRRRGGPRQATRLTQKEIRR